MVMRVRCAGNAPKAQTVLPPVLPRKLARRDNALAQRGEGTGELGLN